MENKTQRVTLGIIDTFMFGLLLFGVIAMLYLVSNTLTEIQTELKEIKATQIK